MPTLQEHAKRLDALETDMWFGKDADNPSVVTRLDRLEISYKRMDKLSWLVIAAIAAAVVDIIQTHLK